MPKLHDPRIVKVFFSSPFGGMEEEREELTRRYFPQIHHLCNSHGLQFVAVDMRWGITAESSDNAQVINICLREIDRSDMFVGFFGQRYGWHGAEDTVLQGNFDNAVGRYPWLEKFRDKSVTELEFLHGFLNDPGQIPATLFFRDKSYDDAIREEGVKKGDKKQIFKYSAESDLSTQLMDDLKRRVWDEREKSLGVHMKYKTPAEAAEIMFNTIMAHLKQTLLADVEYKKPSRREELLNQHDAFLASRCNVFVHGEEYLKLLNDQLLSENGGRVLVTSDAGCGKSALLCNWIAALKREKANYAIVYHFIGFAESSTDVTSILSRLVEEFEYINDQMIDGTPKISPTNTANGDTAEQARVFIQRLQVVLEKLLSVGKRPILVLDGLDKVTTASKIRKVLFWLPSNFPPSCMVTVSTLLSDSRKIEELKSRNYSTIQLEPLPLDSRQQMCVKTLQESGKEMSAHQLEKIVAADMTKIPLFLKITLSELISFGYFRLLDKKIESLTSSKSIEELFEKVLERLEEDYNVADYHGNLVEQVMCCIQLSHKGLSETEIKEMFSIPDHVWSPLYFAIEKLVVNQSGRIQYGFTEWTAAVMKKYLSDEDKKTFYLEKMIEFFNVDLKRCDIPGTIPQFCHAAMELPWLWQELGDKEGLANCLTNYVVFSQMTEHSIYELGSLWRHTEFTGQEIGKQLLTTFDYKVAQLYTYMEGRSSLDTSQTPGLCLESFLGFIYNFLSVFGYTEAKEEIILRNIRVLTEGLKHEVVDDGAWVESRLDAVQYNLACLYCEVHNKEEEGIKLHEQLLHKLETQLQQGEPTKKQVIDLGQLYHGIGVGYFKLMQFDKVIEYCKKSLEQCEKKENPLEPMSSSWNNIALSYMNKNELEKAMMYIDKSIKAGEEHYFGELPPIIGELLTNKAVILRRMDKPDEAEKFYHKSLQVKINAVGREHPIVAIAYMNLGSLEIRRGNANEAVEYERQARQIFEALGQTWDNPRYIEVLENLMAGLTDLLQFEEVDKTIMQLLEWRIADKSMDGSLWTLYREMICYYLREGIHYEKAYSVTCALLDSKHKTDVILYVFLDMALTKLPEEYRTNLPEIYTLKYAIQQNPGNVHLVKHYCENHLIPAGDADSVGQLVNQLHSLSEDMGAQVYVQTCKWCVIDGLVQEACQRRIIEEGLKIYPDDLELLLEMSKGLFRHDKPAEGLKYAVRVADQQMDNQTLLFYTARLAAMAGEWDTSTKYCQHILNNSQDEQMIQQVNVFLQKMDEERTRQTENTATDETLSTNGKSPTESNSAEGKSPTEGNTAEGKSPTEIEGK